MTKNNLLWAAFVLLLSSFWLTTDGRLSLQLLIYVVASVGISTVTISILLVSLTIKFISLHETDTPRPSVSERIMMFYIIHKESILALLLFFALGITLWMTKKLEASTLLFR